MSDARDDELETTGIPGDAVPQRLLKEVQDQHSDGEDSHEEDDSDDDELAEEEDEGSSASEDEEE